MTEPQCKSFAAIGNMVVGGKAAGLVELRRMGLAVPAGFVIIDATPERLPTDLEQHYAALGGGRVAVRSSAVGEDSEEASFAGQYDTILDVEGIDALRSAVIRCLQSAHNDRSRAYRHGTDEQNGPAMSVVVQNMVDACAAGVVFTAHPVTARRDRLVVDAVHGLGEALVSGHATPDHWVLTRDGYVDEYEPQGHVPVLTQAELKRLCMDALQVESSLGRPVDLEWAVDRQRRLWWLQARPITTLPADPNELDTRTHPSHVYTWCNIGEMMPGAVTPLTHSVTARGVDIGMQRMYRTMGAPGSVGDEPRFVAMFFGHLFLNLSAIADLSAYVAGADKRQMCLAICGRDIEEVVAPRPKSMLRRALNGFRYGRMLLSAKRHREALDALTRNLSFPKSFDARTLFSAIDAQLPRVWEAYEHHLISSAGSGALAPILLGLIGDRHDPSTADHAEVARLLAGAQDVESADIAAGAERIIDKLGGHPDAQEKFAQAAVEDAIQWIRSPEAGDASVEFESYLARHGHRAVRELELRQQEWAAEPTPLIVSLQLGLRARALHPAPQVRHQQGGPRPAHPKKEASQRHGAAVRRLLPLAHAAVRSREHTKSALVEVTMRFRHAYRALGRQMASESLLPDEDSIFFLTHSEIGDLLDGRNALSNVAMERRTALDYQMTFRFPEVFRGRPEPLKPPTRGPSESILTGKPVSRGVVTGNARVVRNLAEAAGLQAGEILIAPITDVGWTPYFSLIAGLATDVGSAVSHGAVVAREYGLPAVVNLRNATWQFRTGDRVTLDGNRGTLALAESRDNEAREVHAVA